MAADVLAEIDRWFDVNIFAAAAQVRRSRPRHRRHGRGRRRLFPFRPARLPGRRDCARGVARHVRGSGAGLFHRWNDALARVLGRSGLSPRVARRRSTDALVTIQGALVLARALDDPRLFGQAMADMTTRLLARPD